MRERKVLIDTLGGLTRMAVLEDGVPVEYAVEAHARKRLVGSLYLSRVVNVVKGMQAAFVDIGMERNAFLPLDDVPPMVRELSEAHKSAWRAGAVSPGQEILVQVVREPAGDKGPRVTMNPTFPGKYAVLLPTVQAVGVSRHIREEAKREELHRAAKAACPKGMGLIVRTAAEDAAPEAIGAEAAALQKAWEALALSARTRKAPVLLLDEGSLLLRAERDLGAEIIRGPFDEELESALEKALRRKIWLNSGAFLVIDVCEAMTVIDVNSGKFTGKRNLADTILRVNREAAAEIARLIRLWDMGGIIVVDFVDMQTDEDRQAVLSAFLSAMEPDRAKRHVHGFTGAGLLEMTRRPVYQPVREAMTKPCPRCGEEGTVPSAEWAAHGLLRGIRRRRRSGDESEIICRAPADVLGAIRQFGVPEGVVLEEGGEAP